MVKSLQETKVVSLQSKAAALHIAYIMHMSQFLTKYNKRRNAIHNSVTNKSIWKSVDLRQDKHSLDLESGLGVQIQIQITSKI